MSEPGAVKTELDVYTVQQAAIELDMSYRTVHRILDSGDGRLTEITVKGEPQQRFVSGVSVRRLKKQREREAAAGGQ
jgi:hypothetical protein